MGTTHRPASRRREGLIALAVVLGAAMVGVSIFGALAWRAVTIRRADASDALRRFTTIRARVPATVPMVRRDRAGRFVRSDARPRQGATASRLRVLAYRVQQEHLVEADVPLWFVGVKGPAMQFALRGTGIDFQSLGVTAADLERAGAAVVLDETRSNGDRILAWTE
jgi:hypothetical protein